MDPVFNDLSRLDAMVVLAAATFAGSIADDLFSYLPDEQAERLRAKFDAIQQIPKERRVTLLVQEVKKLFGRRAGVDLSSVNHLWLAHALRKERPEMTSIILAGLPFRVAAEVEKVLAAKLAGRQSNKAVHPDILATVRATLERRFAKIPGHAAAKDRTMRDLLLLSSPAVIQLVDILGARAIAPAVISLGTDAPKLFGAQLSEVAARALKEACQKTTSKEHLSVEDARRELTKLGDVRDVKYLVKRAGMMQLAFASLSEGEGFIDKLAERQPGYLSRALISWGAALTEAGGPAQDVRQKVLSALDSVPVEFLTDSFGKV